jgi:NDP-sugar pyrophosphorylase family protein
MAEYKVLITTSGLGSRIGNITKFSNKSLVRVGDKPMLSHIIESYPEDVDFVITLGHYGSHVKQFLQMAYPDKKIQYVEVDNYSGEGSSLLYSISLCESHLQQPFIFHACDTLLSSDYITKINFDSDWSIGCKVANNSSYRTINTIGNKISSINEKGETSFDFAYVGVSGIKSYDLFWKILKDILQKNNSTELSDCHVIQKMLYEKQFQLINVDKWYDIGNVDSLNQTKLNFPPSIYVLDKEDENIFILNNSVIKFFHNKKICSDRIARCNYLGSLIPELLSSSENFYQYRYVEADLLSDVNDLNKFKSLLEWSKDNIWIKKDNPDKEEYLNNAISFYKDKTVLRIESFLSKYNIKDSKDVINGIEIPTIKELLDQIDFQSIVGEYPTGFHGDFILDNILINDDKFTLIDWRQDFNGMIESGDMNYDLAKLNHNLILNHSVLANNHFNIDIDDNIHCDVFVKKSLIDCKRILKSFCLKNNIDFNNIELLTSLIWINMSPLHEHPLDLFLYYFGKYNLSLCLKNHVK